MNSCQVFNSAISDLAAENMVFKEFPFLFVAENGDAESGIGEGVADPVTTPTTVKSPPNPNAGLPTYYRQLTHSVSEEEGGGGSRRSSISEGTPSNGHSLLPSQDGMCSYISESSCELVN